MKGHTRAGIETKKEAPEDVVPVASPPQNPPQSRSVTMRCRGVGCKNTALLVRSLTASSSMYTCPVCGHTTTISVGGASEF